jgi:8-oxo-dGTP pyrophosphatase MutT (NUDIX family)
LNQALRVLLTGFHNLLKLSWFVRQPRTFGAHAIALTPAGRIVLVKLRYAEGWRLPGGGRKEVESPEAAVVREFKEEIGMTAYGDILRACDLEEATDFKRDLASLLIVRDVEYQPPRWSWEVEDILETSIDDLPADLSPRTAKGLGTVFPSF